VDVSDLAAEVAEATALIPALASATDLEVTPLTGVINLNNHSYRATTAGRSYLLRLPGRSAEALGVRRDHELAAARAAAAAEVAPEVLYGDVQGRLLTAWVDGLHWPREALHDASALARLAEALRRLHRCRPGGTGGSIYRRVEHLLDSARRLGQSLPADIDTLLARAHRLEAERQADPRYQPVLCHHDLWTNNFLDDGERLWLLDWEFAGLGDGLYDLAVVAMNGQLSEDEETSWLAACGYDQTGDLDLLRRMKTVVVLFEACWALVQHGLLGSAGHDYLGYAARTFERLAAEP